MLKKLLYFVSVSFHRNSNEILKSPINSFYHKFTNSTCLFTDQIGNIFKINSNNTGFDLISKKPIPCLDNIVYNDESLLYSYYITGGLFQKSFRKTTFFKNGMVFQANNKISSVLLSSIEENSTCLEVFNSEFYLNFDIYGNIKRYPLYKNKNVEKEEASKTKHFKLKLFNTNHFQHLILFEKYIFSITDKNRLQVYSFNETLSSNVENTTIETIFSIALSYTSLVKKIMIKKFGIFIQILLWYNDNTIEIITIRDIEYKNIKYCLSFYNSNSIEKINFNNIEIVDIDFNQTFVAIFSKKRLFLFEYNPLYKHCVKILDRYYDFPYFTKIVWFDEKYIIFNEQKFIPFMIIHTNSTFLLKK